MLSRKMTEIVAKDQIIHKCRELSKTTKNIKGRYLIFKRFSRTESLNIRFESKLSFNMMEYLV